MEIPESDPDESCLSLAVFVLKKKTTKSKNDEILQEYNFRQDN